MGRARYNTEQEITRKGCRVPQLSELQMRILAELEEAGEENVPTIMNTVMEPTGDPSEVDAIQQALEGLVQADFISMSIDLDAAKRLKVLSQDQSLAVIADLRAGLGFRASDRHWMDIRRKGPPYSWSFPYILATSEARRKGREILMERGHNWWRSPT